VSDEKLQAEVVRLNKIIQALMDRAERNENVQGSDFDLFHTAVLLEEQVQRRTRELQAVLAENELITRALRESEVKFHAVVEQSLVGITLLDGKKFVYANPKFAAMTGYSVEELMQMGALEITPPQERAKTAELIQSGITGKSAPSTFVVNVLRKDGQIMNAEISAALPIEIGGQTVLMSMWSDVTDRLRVENEVKALNDLLRNQAIRDPLTGLFNRRYLEETLERELEMAQRQGYEVSLIMGDIDHFKAINDTFGHQAGDEVLRRFSELIQLSSRASDVCCRYGGEEFLLVLPNVSEEIAAQRAEEIRLAIAQTPIRVGTTDIRVTLSFGVATYPAHGDSAEILVAAVDAALYMAKSSGRNQVSCSKPRFKSGFDVPINPVKSTP
jgi:diguanylate cyclase (GGDEF)-like protein/PAS domain S-box-containing protein